MTAKKQDTKQKQPKSFEASIERLEKIVADMEGGKLSLDDMIARFEEGQALIKLCSAKLDEVEKKIEVLVTKEDGSPATEPLEEIESETSPDGAEEGELF